MPQSPQSWTDSLHHVMCTGYKLPNCAYLQDVVWEAGHNVLDDVIRLLIPGAVIGQDHKVSLHSILRLSSRVCDSDLGGREVWSFALSACTPPGNAMLRSQQCRLSSSDMTAAGHVSFSCKGGSSALHKLPNETEESLDVKACWQKHQNVLTAMLDAGLQRVQCNVELTMNPVRQQPLQ